MRNQDKIEKEVLVGKLAQAQSFAFCAGMRLKRYIINPDDEDLKDILVGIMTVEDLIRGAQLNAEELLTKG